MIAVAAGSYPEQLSITKSVTIAGAGSSSTFIAPTSLTTDAAGMITVSGSVSVS